MGINEKYMQRCIELARFGAGYVSPNPMVGCVIVSNRKIIGEGFHQNYGDAHAEVNAINSVKDQELLRESTLYVSLEPCSHYGKTPPCSDLIVSKKIPRVVIGSADPNKEVAGRGIKRLMDSGIDVTVGTLEAECRELNKRFFTFHKKNRPYIILKWAQTLDGFIDINRDKSQYGKPTWITGELSRRLVHKMRAEEDAIMIGTTTAERDNPSLTVYRWSGRNPVRVVIDNSLRLPENIKLFDNTSPTLIFNSVKTGTIDKTDFVRIDFSQNVVPRIVNELYKRGIQSVIIEGGKQLLQSFINVDLWDEAHLFVADKIFYNGVPAPRILGEVVSETMLDSDLFKVIRNPQQADGSSEI